MVYVLELSGLYVFATSGALMAVHKGFDIVGIVVLALLTALVFDAAGLALFCVTGTLKALDYHLGSVQAVLLGVTTAVGGGVLRDITARETPALVQVDTDLYSIPAAAGAVVVAGAYRTDLPMPIVATCAAVLVFLFRIVAMLRHWTAPRAWNPEGRDSAS